MAKATNFDQFCAALEAADIAAVRDHLARNPEFAVAVTSDGWPVFQLQFDEEISELLVDHGADANVRNCRGETLLHLTADPDLLRKVFALGADINALDHRGYTPMMAHAPYSQTCMDAIYTLFAEGGDPNVVGLDGETVFTLLPKGGRFNELRRYLRGEF